MCHAPTSTCVRMHIYIHTYTHTHMYTYALLYGAWLFGRGSGLKCEVRDRYVPRTHKHMRMYAYMYVCMRQLIAHDCLVEYHGSTCAVGICTMHASFKSAWLFSRGTCNIHTYIHRCVCVYASFSLKRMVIW